MSFKIGNQTYFSSTTRYTTPSVHLTKGTSNTYIPLLKGSKGAVVKFGDYNYTLGGLKVGDYRGAISRVLANNVPGVTIIYEGNWVKNPSTLEATITNMQIKLNDPDGDVMSLKVYYGVINVTSGSGVSMDYTQIGSLTASNLSNGYKNLPKFSIPSAGGYNGIKYFLRFVVYDSKGEFSSKDLYIYNEIPSTEMLVNGKLYWFDNRTMYYGYYSSDFGTIYITSHSGSGSPYFQIGGFDPSLEGETVSWRFIQGETDITSKIIQNAKNINNYPTISKFNGIFNNIDGNKVGNQQTGPNSYVGDPIYGIKCFEGWMPNGNYDLILTVNNSKFLIHFVINDPENK